MYGCYCQSKKPVKKFSSTHVVHIVEDADARLLLASLSLFSVVRLSLLQSPSSAPLTVGAASRSWNPLSSGSPVPTIDNSGLEVFTITSLEVTLPSSGPDVVKILLADEVVDPVLLSNRVNGDGVHAKLAAVVPRAFPVPLGVGSHC